MPERTIKTRLTRAHGQLRGRLSARYCDRFGHWAPALVLYSGHVGLMVSPISVSVVGFTLMKKVVLIAAVLAVALLVPVALHWADGGDTQSNSEDSVLALRDSVSDATLQAGADREMLGRPSQLRAGQQASSEHAFPPLPESQVGSLGVRVHWTDGAPAVHLKLGIMPSGTEDPFLMSRTVYTDASGFAKVDGLPAGKVTVFYSRLGSDEVAIVAGEHTVVVKEASRGTLFSGQVMSPGGSPVGGALIYVADSRGGDSLPEPTGIADATGRYRIENVFDRSYISARAPGFSPSIPIETGVTTGMPTKLNLTLRGNPATLRGIALSPSGLPVVGAKIRIDLPAVIAPRKLASVTAGRSGFPLAFFMRTDAEGRFESDQVGAGSMRITARTATWQPWVESVDLEAGAAKEITIRFAHGVQLTGTVGRENGEPLVGAMVFAGRKSAPDSFRVQTDAKGVFRIHGLPPGAIDLEFYQRGFETLISPVMLSAGTPNQIDVTLHELQTVGGYVHDEAGTPLSRWLVVVESPVGLWVTSAWTDHDGKFELNSIPDGTTDLIVTTKSFQESAVRLVLDSVLPARGPLQIVVPDAARPKSSIQMKLLVDGVPAPIETRIRLLSVSKLPHRDVHPKAHGSLHLQKLASQDFQLVISLPGYATLHRSIKLGIAEDLDLGTINLDAGGRVQVFAPKSTGATVCHVLDARGQSLRSFVLRRGEGVLAPLPTGAVVLRLNSASGATQFADVVVVRGETAVVRFAARPGVARELRLTRMNGIPLRFRTAVSVADTQGRVHFYSGDFRRQRNTRGGSVLGLSGLMTGSYRVRVTDPGGQTHESWLKVDAMGGSGASPESIRLSW